jgi:hypothetical protein
MMNELIEEDIANGRWRDLLDRSSDVETRLIDIDLRAAVYDDRELMACTKIDWRESFSFEKGLVVFFPNTSVESDKVLYTDKYGKFADLDNAIQNALKETKVGTTNIHQRNIKGLKMAIAIDSDHIFRFWGVRNGEHNYYINWMSALNRYNSKGYTSSVLENVPALIEMDGSMNLVNIVILYPAEDHDYVLNMRAIKKMYFPIKEMMFNCEKIVRDNFQTPIKTVSSKDAELSVRVIELKSASKIELPLEEDESDMTSVGSGVSVDLEEQRPLQLINNNNSNF